MSEEHEMGEAVSRLKTRERVLLAAGELFARNGFDATAVRDILEKADAHSAAIHYHFHSKERLYYEALRYVLERVMAQSAAGLAKDAAVPATPAEAARRIAEVIGRTVRNYLCPSLPRWYVQLVIRSLSTEDEEIRRVVHEVLHPDYEAIMRLFRAAVPGMTEREGYLYSYSITGEIAFYCLARGFLSATLGESDYSEAFLAELSAHVSRLILRGLGLPDVARDEMA